MTKTLFRIEHPSGEVSTRRSATDYRYATVAAFDRADEIEAARRRAEMLEAEGHRAAASYRREVKRLESFDHPLTYATVSFHTRYDLAERKAAELRARGFRRVTIEEVTR